jgi:hypothetical protein
MRGIDSPLLKASFQLALWLTFGILAVSAIVIGIVTREVSQANTVSTGFALLVTIRFLWMDAQQVRFWRHVSALRRRYIQAGPGDEMTEEGASLSVPLDLASRWNSLLGIVLFVIFAPLAVILLLIVLFHYHVPPLELAISLFCMLLFIALIAYMYSSSPVLNAFYQRVYVDEQGVTVTVFGRRPEYIAWVDVRAFLCYSPPEAYGSTSNKNVNLERAIYELSTEQRTIYWNWRSLAPMFAPAKTGLPASFKNASQFVEQFNRFIMQKTSLPLHVLTTSEIMSLHPST